MRINILVSANVWFCGQIQTLFFESLTWYLLRTHSSPARVVIVVSPFHKLIFDRLGGMNRAKIFLEEIGYC